MQEAGRNSAITRSRAGCTECRRRRRKCDEAKPTCSNCKRAERSCSYVTQLSWGGRSFVKSRFGKCLSDDANLVRLSSQPGDFVYGSRHISPTKRRESKPNDPFVEIKRNSSSDIVNNASKKPHDPSNSEPPPLVAHDPPASEKSSAALLAAQKFQSGVPQNPDHLSWLPVPYRRLLDHFLSSMTRSISAHEYVQNDYCRTLLPMALGTSHLLAAILSLAGTHRKSLGLDQSEAQLAHLKATSVRQFRHFLSNPGFQDEDTGLATSLVLCISEIVSGSEKPGSWRSHLKGAAAILDKSVKKGDFRPLGYETTSKSFLWRWYISFETLALLSGKPMLSSGSRNLLQLTHGETDDFIDDLGGFSFKLIRVFGEINLLTVERRTIQEALSSNDSRNELMAQVSELMLVRGNRLVNEIKSMQLADVPKFRSCIDNLLSAETRADYLALNEAFHHVALLQVFRRVLDYPSSGPEVQLSVKRILSLLSGMTIKNRPCPGVAMLQPAFAAGCEACEVEDRDVVLSLLNGIENLYGMGNVRRARELLKELWARRDDEMDFTGRIRWDDVVGLGYSALLNASLNTLHYFQFELKLTSAYAVVGWHSLPLPLKDIFAINLSYQHFLCVETTGFSDHHKFSKHSLSSETELPKAARRDFQGVAHAKKSRGHPHPNGKVAEKRLKGRSTSMMLLDRA